MVAFSWSDSEGQRQAWAQVLRLKDDKIVGIQDFASAGAALRFVRLRTAVA